VLGFTVFYEENDGYAILRRDEVAVHLTGAPDESWRTRTLATGSSPVDREVRNRQLQGRNGAGQRAMLRLILYRWLRR